MLYVTVTTQFVLENRKLHLLLSKKENSQVMTQYLNDFDNNSQDFTEQDLVRNNNKHIQNDGKKV